MAVTLFHNNRSRLDLSVRENDEGRKVPVLCLTENGPEGIKRILIDLSRASRQQLISVFGAQTVRQLASHLAAFNPRPLAMRTSIPRLEYEEPARTPAERFLRDRLFDRRLIEKIAQFCPIEPFILLDQFPREESDTLSCSAYQGLDPDVQTSINEKLLTFAILRGKAKLTNQVIAKMTSNELGALLIEAAKKGHPEVVNALIQCDRFGEINIEELGWTLTLAAQNGHEQIVNALIQCNRFGEIPAANLGLALSRAAQNGHEQIVNALIHSNRFGEIAREYLGQTLYFAAQHGYLQIVNAPIQCNRFGEIHVEDLGWALHYAVQNGHLDAVNALIQCNRFSEISANDFALALSLASKQQNAQIMNALVQCNRFDEITDEALRIAIQHANHAHHENVAAILQAAYNKRIQAREMKNILIVTFMIGVITLLANFLNSRMSSQD